MTTPFSSPVPEQQRTTPGGLHLAPRISIALCTYNGARFLQSQLDSFVAQTRRPDELVVCDDGSADDSIAILERFAKQAPFPVRIERNPERLGSTKNFEKAIGLCSGDLIATSDQDDVWLPEKLALSEAAFAREPDIGLLFTDAEVVDMELRPVGHTLWKSIQFGRAARRQALAGSVFDVLLRQWLVTGATMMVRSSWRPFVLPIPGEWVHDAWIALIVGAMAPVRLLERATLKYRQHPGQQIGGKRFGLKDLYEKARSVGPPYFRLAHERFQLVRKRLQAFAPQVRDPKFLVMVDGKVEHQRRRLEIAECRSRYKRAALALAELLRGGYWRYSPNSLHFFQDLLF